MDLDLNKLGKDLETNLPEISFAYLFGSAQSGVVKAGSDVDIAFYVNENFSINPDIISKIYQVFEKIYPTLQLDISFLNTTSPILSFEAISGKRLFLIADFLEKYLNFFSLTARKYEDEIFWQKRQLEYRGYK